MRERKRAGEKQRKNESYDKNTTNQTVRLYFFWARPIYKLLAENVRRERERERENGDRENERESK